MELDLATGIPQDTASVLYALLPHTNTQTLCLFPVLSSLLFFWHRVFLLFSLFSHVPSCWSYSATGHRPWSFALDEDKKDEKKKKKDDRPLHPEVYPVNYKSVGEFSRRLDTTNIFLTRDCLLD